MIRVNLLRNRIGDSGLAAPGPAMAVQNPEMRESLIKILLMVIFVVGLMVYEGQVIRGLNADMVRIQAELVDLQAQAQAKAQEVESIKDMEKEARELEDKLKVLKLLSRLRLREVKTLDFMQSSIPEKVWLKSVHYNSEEIQSQKGRLVFTGNAAATEDLTEFVRRLEESSYLDEVIIIKNQEVNVQGRSTTMRDFEFTARVESKK
ncbi:MAG: PilN domain-containing protein [Bdellovibrionales bacterium]